MMNPPGAPGAPQKKGLSTGCIVAIVAAVVLGLGGVTLVFVIGALGVYGTRRYLAAAKTAEAKNEVGAIARAAEAAYARDRALCASASPVPASLADVKHKKYMPSPSDYGGSARAGWTCLKFSLATPSYYQLH
ncbi:MAG TPA: hypothetical protein VHB21_01905, partial [Minicystis sp.]|nr:hypothetical protein [Minicystis sp.]